MKVLHYVDCASLSWEVPYIAHMKAMAGLGVEQTLLCRAGDNLERLAREQTVCPECGRSEFILGYPLGSKTGFVKYHDSREA